MAKLSNYGFKNHFDVINTSRFMFDDVNVINLQRDPVDKSKFTYEDSSGNLVEVNMLRDGTANFKVKGEKEINLSIDESVHLITNNDPDYLSMLKKENKKIIDLYAKGGESMAIGGKLTKSQITGKEKGKLLDVLYKAKFDAEQAGNKSDVTLIEKLISKSIKGADISDSVEFKTIFAQGGNYFGYFNETPDTDLNFQPSYDYAKGGGVHTMPNGEVMLDSEHYAKGGDLKAKHVLHIDGQNWFLEKIDNTHFYMSNSKEHRGMAHHIGQHRGEPYYEEVKQWLKDTYATGGYIISASNKDKITDAELGKVLSEINDGYGWITIDGVRQVIEMVTGKEKFDLTDKVDYYDDYDWQYDENIIEYLRNRTYIFPTEDDEKLGNTSEDINILSVQRVKRDRSGPYATSGTSIDECYLSVDEELGETDIYKWAKDLWRTSIEAPISHSFELEKAEGRPLHGYLSGRNEWILIVKETIYYN